MAREAKESKLQRADIISMILNAKTESDLLLIPKLDEAEFYRIILQPLPPHQNILFCLIADGNFLGAIYVLNRIPQDRVKALLENNRGPFLASESALEALLAKKKPGTEFSKNDVQMAKVLLGKGADVRKKDSEGRMVFMKMMHHGSAEMVKVFLDHMKKEFTDHKESTKGLLKKILIFPLKPSSLFPGVSKYFGSKSKDKTVPMEDFLNQRNDFQMSSVTFAALNPDPAVVSMVLDSIDKDHHYQHLMKGVSSYNAPLTSVLNVARDDTDVNLIALAQALRGGMTDTQWKNYIDVTGAVGAALTFGRHDIATFLLASGANIHGLFDGVPPVAIAIMLNDVNALRECLFFGADIYSEYYLSSTRLTKCRFVPHEYLRTPGNNEDGAGRTINWPSDPIDQEIIDIIDYVTRYREIANSILKKEATIGDLEDFFSTVETAMPILHALNIFLNVPIDKDGNTLYHRSFLDQRPDIIDYMSYRYVNPEQRNYKHQTIFDLSKAKDPMPAGEKKKSWSLIGRKKPAKIEQVVDVDFDEKRGYLHLTGIHRRNPDELVRLLDAIFFEVLNPEKKFDSKALVQTGRSIPKPLLQIINQYLIDNTFLWDQIQTSYLKSVGGAKVELVKKEEEHKGQDEMKVGTGKEDLAKELLEQKQKALEQKRLQENRDILAEQDREYKELLEQEKKAAQLLASSASAPQQPAVLAAATPPQASSGPGEEDKKQHRLERAEILESLAKKPKAKVEGKNNGEDKKEDKDGADIEEKDVLTSQELSAPEMPKEVQWHKASSAAPASGQGSGLGDTPKTKVKSARTKKKDDGDHQHS